MSKETVVTASSVSVRSSPGRSRIEPSRFPSARWLTATPFGRPVDPDV
jgi:hypothetical protein